MEGISTSQNAVIRPTRAQISCDLEGEVVILGLRDGTYYRINRMGARIWSLIQNSSTFSQIVETLLKDFDVSRAECEADVGGFLESLHRHGLIAVENEPDS